MNWTGSISCMTNVVLSLQCFALASSLNSMFLGKIGLQLTFLRKIRVKKSHHQPLMNHVSKFAILEMLGQCIQSCDEAAQGLTGLLASMIELSLNKMSLEILFHSFVRVFLNTIETKRVENIFRIAPHKGVDLHPFRARIEGRYYTHGTARNGESNVARHPGLTKESFQATAEMQRR